MGQKYALNRDRTGLQMAFQSKIDPVTGLPPHRHSLKFPGKWKQAVSDSRKWRSPLNILGETSWRNLRSKPCCAQSHHLHLNRRQYDGWMAQRGEKMGLLGTTHPSLLWAVPAYAGDERFEGHCGRERLLCRHIKRRRSL